MSRIFRIRAWVWWRARSAAPSGPLRMRIDSAAPAATAGGSEVVKMNPGA